MAIGSIGGFGNALVSHVQGGTNVVQASNSNTQNAGQTVISETSNTSLNGQVTTITNYADGTSRTTVSDGDVIVIRSGLRGA